MATFFLPASLLIAQPVQALPPWAYGQRQQLSPIRVEGDITASHCQGDSCRVEMRVTTVLRNRSSLPLHAGDRITIMVAAAHPSAASEPGPGQPPPSGGSGVDIPAIGSHRMAWLRPSPASPGRFELMAGPYGFGPDLEPLAGP